MNDREQNSIKDYRVWPKRISNTLNYDRHGLVSLEGAPTDYMGGSFYVRENYLTSLRYSPKIVKGSFRCEKNNLKSLEGAPVIVGEPNDGTDFMCRSNKELETLRGAPKMVLGGAFLCWDCPKLNSLEHLPERIDAYVSCDDELKEGENLYLIANALINARVSEDYIDDNFLGVLDGESEHRGMEQAILEDVLIKYFT